MESDTKKALVEIKMIVEIEMEKHRLVVDAIEEMSENISTSDLISSNGCIVSGKIGEYSVKEITFNNGQE